MTPSELIKLLARSTAEGRRRREADEAWFRDWLQEAIEQPDEQTPPWLLDDDGVGHRILGFDSMWGLPVRECDEEHMDPFTVVEWTDPAPKVICAICSPLDDDELEFQRIMRERGGSR